VNISTCPRCKAGDVFDLERTEHGLCQNCEVRLAEERTYAVATIVRMRDDGLISAGQAADLIDKVTDQADSFTADRERIVIGGAYFDYDLQPTIVTGISSVSLDHRERDGAAIWWRTTTGMFDGTRLAARRAS
jgi:hypothetical protein